jgi:hypothetical protein
VGGGAEAGADRHACRGLPEVHPERQHRQHADEDRGELQVRRGPRPEQLARFAVPVGLGDELVPAGFDRDYPVSVGAVGGGLGDSHGYTVA